VSYNQRMNRVGLALLLSCSFAHAETKASKDAGLAVTVPQGWKLSVKDAGITGESKEKEVALLAWSVDVNDVDAMEKKLEGELFSAVANLKWDKPTTGKIHGLAATYVTSTGHAVGGDVAIRAAVIGPGTLKKSLLVALVVKVDKLAKHKPEIQAILASVQPAK
jgi:hypothetical protein